MMTIKHVSDDQRENVFETIEVSYDPAHTREAGGPPSTVWARSIETDELVPFTGGIVYVMNAHGSTVARYNLMGKPV